MEQFNYTTKKKEYKHILRDDRYVIEQMLNAGKKMSDIIDVIGCSEKTLKREIKRGTWEYLDGSTYKIKPKYSWDVAQRKHDENANGIIRRFFPKGTDFSKISLKRIQYVEDWINNYPRKILGGISANLMAEQICPLRG